MELFIIIFVAGVLLQVLQYFCENKFGKNWLLSLVKIVAYVAVGAAGLCIVLLSRDIFKEFEGYVCAVVLSILVPRMIDFILGVTWSDDNANERHILV